METSTSRKAILWIAVVFVFGLALGGVGGYYVSHRIYAAPAPQTDEAKRAHRVEQLTDELNLTSAQQQRLDQILASAQARYRAIHEQYQPSIEEVRQKARSEIRAILTPEQKPKFELFLNRLDEERRRSGR